MNGPWPLPRPLPIDDLIAARTVRPAPKRESALIIDLPQSTIAPRCEVVRSFTYKLNVGNYEARDFFCSQKVECDVAEVSVVAQRVHDFCKRQVMAAVRAYQEEAEQAFGPVPTTKRRA